MKKRKNPLYYLSVIKYILLLFCFMIFGSLERETFPYSVAPFAAALNLGFSLVISLAELILASVILGAYGSLLPIAVSAVFLAAVKLLYSRLRIKVNRNSPFLPPYRFYAICFSEIPRLIQRLKNARSCFSSPRFSRPFYT